MALSEKGLPLVDLDGIDIKIAGKVVLRDVDWQIRAGRHWGIVGANGSGKSSLLGIVGGSLWPAPGKGRRRYGFDGRIHGDAVEAKRRIVSVSPELQDRYTRWELNFSALDVVLSGVFRTDIPRRRAEASETERALRLLAEFGLEDLSNRRFLKLSRGEQRRVLLARAMAFEPEILLLDEPAAGLDCTSREQLERSIAAIARDTVVVAAAHAIDELPSIVTDVLLLGSNRIEGLETIALGGEEPPIRHRDSAIGNSRKTDRDRFVERKRDPARLPLIEIDHANIWRGEKLVLCDICWRLDDDQHWLIGGPNGSGKSTFLRLLHGQLRPARGGTIRWPGLGDPRNVWVLRRKIAFVSPELQAEYLLPATVRECVASGFDSSIGLTRRLRPEELDRVQELLERFELASLSKRDVKTLSYGQLRRTLIARTLVNNPRVLLLDEPTEGLDRDAARLVFDQIALSIAEGTRLVCASHLDDVGDHFTHRLRLETGAIQVEDVYAA